MARLLESSIRPLKPPERRLLGAKIRDLDTRLGKGPKFLGIVGAAISLLWILTLAASEAPWLLVTAFWIVVGAGITVWVGHDLKKDLRGLADVRTAYQSALRSNRAEEFAIESRSFVEFEEVEDEGAYYAFEIDDDRIVFVSGQEFYPEAKFPSHDFSLVYVLDEDGRRVDMVIEKRGPSASPVRIVPAATKWTLELPEHLEVLAGSLANLETLLRR